MTKGKVCNTCRFFDHDEDSGLIRRCPLSGLWSDGTDYCIKWKAIQPPEEPSEEIENDEEESDDPDVGRV